VVKKTCSPVTLYNLHKKYLSSLSVMSVVFKLFNSRGKLLKSAVYICVYLVDSHNAQKNVF